MKKQLTERQEKIHARNKKMGPAMIESPLKFIKARTNGSWRYKEARVAADLGRGGVVRKVAFEILRDGY